MFAFKILNLRRISTGITLSLLTLALGLTALLLSGTHADFFTANAVPPSIPNGIFTLLWAIVFAMSGTVLYSVCCEKIPDSTLFSAIYFSAFILSLLWQITLFRFCLFILSALLAASALLLVFLVARVLVRYNTKAFCFSVIHGILLAYSIYFSIGCAILR